MAAVPRRAAAGGGAVPLWRRPGGSGRRQAGRGAPVEAKEASYGLVWARERVEEGAPRETDERRR